MPKQTFATILTYAGTLPFIVIAFAALTGVELAGLNPTLMMLTYGAVIISFVAGTHWGIYLYRDAPFNLFVHSNLITLLAWGGLCSAILLQVTFVPILYILCFAILWVLDERLHKQGLHEDWFMRLRSHATLIVCLALAIFALT